jgi:hypothetical protein
MELFSYHVYSLPKVPGMVFSPNSAPLRLTPNHHGAAPCAGLVGVDPALVEVDVAVDLVEVAFVRVVAVEVAFVGPAVAEEAFVALVFMVVAAPGRHCE